MGAKQTKAILVKQQSQPEKQQNQPQMGALLAIVQDEQQQSQPENNQNQLETYQKLIKLQPLIKKEYNEEMPYFIVLVGPSQSGKSSFLKMICKNDIISQQVKIGDNMKSCTSTFDMYEVHNQDLFGKRGAYILDTIGFGDTSDEFDDIAILSLLHCKLMNAATKLQMRIDCIFMFQSCKSLIKITPLIQDMRLIFGSEVQNHLVLFLTKLNTLNEDDDYTYDEFKEEISKQLTKLEINIPVLDVYTNYTHRRKGVYIPEQQLIDKQQNRISYFLQYKQEALDLTDMWNKILEEANKIIKTMKESDVKKKFTELLDQYNENENFQKEQNKYWKIKLLIRRIKYIFTLRNVIDDLRDQALKEIEIFYEENPEMAQKATEIVLCKNIKKSKSLKQEKQININM
ncbi:hypothetical protein ABPG72_011793 [Tetrahymena utriculariae]